jgi:hypothetical protein
MKRLPKWLAFWPAETLRAVSYLLTGWPSPLSLRPEPTEADYDPYADYEPSRAEQGLDRPYEPTPEDWAEYSSWADTVVSIRPTPDPHAEPWGDFCPADFGEPCPSCDRAAAEAAALAHDADEASDGWYRDMLARADFRHDGWRD